jgi:hypothetical protein
MLLKGEICDEACRFPELDVQTLPVQMLMFIQHCKPTTLQQARVVRGYVMSADMRSLFSQVEQLVRLLLVMPASSCEAERKSFTH